MLRTLPCFAWMLQVSFLVTRDGAKHSPPAGKFQKSESPQARMVKTPFHHDSDGQNEKFTTLIMMIVDVDSTCVHLGSESEH